MGYYGNNDLEFIDESRMIFEAPEDEEGGLDASLGGDEGGDTGMVAGMGGNETATDSNEEDKDEKKDEVNNPSITVGKYMMTINLAKRKVEIEDTVDDNEVELNFVEFKKLTKLFDEVDTRADDKEGGGGLGGLGFGGGSL